MPIIDPAVALSTRQEAFCRHYAVSGNAAGAARQAGYAERSARQTGCALLERPWIVERLRRIRLSWKRTERDEARILLARSEQAWDAAVASGSAYMMLRVLRFQAEIAGLVGPAGGNRARLPVSFGPPPAPANDLPPADDPPEETYDPEQFPGEWANGDRPGEEERAEGAETDWLYQRRNGYDDIYDPWAPDEVEERRQSRLEREREEEARRSGRDRAGDDGGEDGEDPDNDEDWDDDEEDDWTRDEDENGPEDAGAAPDHDRT